MISMGWIKAENQGVKYRSEDEEGGRRKYEKLQGRTEGLKA